MRNVTLTILIAVTYQFVLAGQPINTSEIDLFGLRGAVVEEKINFGKESDEFVSKDESGVLTFEKQKHQTFSFSQSPVLQTLFLIKKHLLFSRSSLDADHIG